MRALPIRRTGLRARGVVAGVTGKIAFDERGDLIKPPYTLFQVQQGQWRSIKTVGSSGV